MDKGGEGDMTNRTSSQREVISAQSFLQCLGEGSEQNPVLFYAYIQSGF